MKGQSEVIDLKIDAENGTMPADEWPGSRPEMTDEHAPSPDHGDDRKILIVGKEIVFNGKISSLDRLVVQGQVEAKIEACREIEIAETGHFKGQVEFEGADIAGIFEGDLTVREHLVVRKTGRITGKVRFGELEIERGGQIIGDLQVFVEGAQANGEGAAAGRKKAPIAEGTGKPAK